jgi:uncharacterized protein (DUF4415 family)
VTDEEISQLFAGIRSFGWHEQKRESNLSRHKIDFHEVTRIFDSPTFIRRSDRMAKSGIRSSDTSRAEKSQSPARSAGTSVGSFRPGARGKTKEGRITIVSREAPRRRGKTDWAAVDALTDEEIAAAVASDPDAVPLDVDWSKAVLVVPPSKKAISIRLDKDVLDYFKQGGAGYQRRINAVLRSYVEQQRTCRKRA